MTVPDFALAVHAFCGFLGGSVTSWGRTRKHNAEVGGVAHSAHQFFLGADVVYDAPVAVAEAQDVAGRLGLKLVRESDHDHVQPHDWRAG